MALFPPQFFAYATSGLIGAAAVAFAIAFCLLAVIFDLRQRSIPNLLNLSALVCASLLAFLSGKLIFSLLLFVAASFAFAFLLYKLGVWAGGDAKFFTALMAFLPVLKASRFELIPLVFLTSAALTLPVLVFLYWRKIRSLRGEFFAAAASSLNPAVFGAASSTAIYILLGVLLGSQANGLPASFAISFAILFGMAFFAKSFGVVSEKILRQVVAVSSLKEGDIPAQSVYLSKGKPAFWQPPSPKQLLGAMLKLDASSLSQSMPPGNKVVSCLAARGISGGEIRKLKKLGVTHLVVKQSVPFAPALALGFLLAAWLA